MATKVIKLQDSNDNILIPVTDASVVQMSVEGQVKSVKDVIIENEEVTAAGYNNLNSRVNDKQDKLVAGDDATRLNGAKLSTKQIFTGSIDTIAGAVPMLLPAGSCIYNSADKKLYIGDSNSQPVEVAKPDDFLFVDTASGTTYRCDGTTLHNIANIKTINGQSLLGGGNVQLTGADFLLEQGAVQTINEAVNSNTKALQNKLDAAHGEVMFADLDTLCTADDMLQGKPACYTVLDTLTTSNGTVTVKVGVLWVYSDNLRHVVMQVLNTNFVLDENNTISGNEHNHDMHEYSRTYAYSTAAGTLHTWSKWQEVGGKGIVDRITNVALAKQDKLTAGQGIKIAGNTISVQVDSTLFVVVTLLPDAPANGNEGKIHLVPLSKTSTNNKYAEYIWRGNTDKWEQLGTISSKMDLSDYSTAEQVKALVKAETDARTAADTAETNARTAADTALGERISALEGDEDVFAGATGDETCLHTAFTGYFLNASTHRVLHVTNSSIRAVLTIGTFLFNDTATGDWYIVDTGKSTTKVQTSITTAEINALF